ncbi:hypothetical protein [Blastopirellula marina]|uniref:DNA-binding protein n=1 Tax=Blastopirellula marina TaxID=124 RepID=A0A2S8GJL7_9BACT|nr:hypothetical protein [Blastopirellula marina]PQO44204.1 hypothetical protein C5Y93_19725 [Blastopirellula marina]
MPKTIDPQQIYPLAAAQEFFGGRDAWLSARRQGLSKYIYYIGKRGFIEGADLAEFIRTSGKRRVYGSAT